MGNERKVWFITRPERDPIFHADALEALQIATDNFKKIWSRNRQLHKQYEEILVEKGLKRNNISQDGSGGRTWAAMLKTFGYIYTSEAGNLSLTKVGKAILTGNSKRENISKQILTLQIPNSYFLEKGFRPKFENSFQIRPARFLIRLVNQKELEYYLTKEEITFFALTAHRDNELKLVTEKIKAFRQSSSKIKEEMKKEIASTFDHRERSDKGSRDYSDTHGDVAHTFMMLCDYTELVDYVRGDALRVPIDKQASTTLKLDELESRYPFSKRYLLSLERFSEHAGLDINSYKASPFGAIAPASNSVKSLRKVQSLLASYPLIQTMPIDKISSILREEFSQYDAHKYATFLVDYRYTTLNEDFVESYLHESNDLTFENKTAEIFKAIGFEVELRPKPLAKNVRTEIEILLHVNEKNICIIDAKNYKKKFTLSANLASHMGSEYIPNYNGYHGKSVSYFGYVTASEWSGDRHLEKICAKAMAINHQLVTHGAIFSAKALLGFLDYCLDNNIDSAERKQLFISCFNNVGYNSVTEMIK